MPDHSDPDLGALPSDRQPDAHGDAALLLAESLLHVLIETKALTVEQAIGAVQTASAVAAEAADDTSGSIERVKRSMALLGGIELSLGTELRSANKRG